MKDAGSNSPATSAKAKRARLRGVAFWVCVGLGALVAGCWAKSYWRSDTLISDPGRLRLGATDYRGVVEVWLHWPMGATERRLLSHETMDAREDFYTVPWTYGGFLHETRSWGDKWMSSTFIPHWFLLLLCLGGAWWTGRPWGKRRRAERRGFDVLARS